MRNELSRPGIHRIRFLCLVLLLSWQLPPTVRAESQLEITNANISASEDGAVASTEYKFLPENTLYVSFEVTGFRVEGNGTDAPRKIELQYEAMPHDTAGRPLVETQTGEIQTELSPEDKNWVPKRRASFRLPALAAPGSYTLRIKVKDLLGKQEAVKELPFIIGGTRIQQTNRLTVQNLRFLRREEDASPITPAAYAVGDSVFVRFEVTGFRLGEGNEHVVTYGVVVTDPNGRPFIQQPNAAESRGKSFYPAQFVPGTFAVDLTGGSAKGAYLITISAKDLLSGEEATGKQAFYVE